MRRRSSLRRSVTESSLQVVKMRTEMPGRARSGLDLLLDPDDRENNSALDELGIMVERRPSCRKRLLKGAAGHRSKIYHHHQADLGIVPESDPVANANQDEEPSPAAPASILKKLDEQELSAYFLMWHVFQDDPVLPFVPKLHGVVEELDNSGNSAKFLRMDNLVQSFRQPPKVMDVKLGVRTFLETECFNASARPDLYEKMKDIYPWELTEAEHEGRSITKHRWMSAHDANTTTLSLGFRLDGVAGYDKGETEELRKSFHHLCKRSNVADMLRRFAEDAVHPEQPGLDGNGPPRASPAQVARDLCERLMLLRAALQASDFFREHECIGSSVLLVADVDGKVGAFWIDFAKTRRLPEDVQVSHWAPWQQGNHEDGVLTGVDNLVSLWGEVSEQLTVKECSQPH